jgi:chemotaxis protein MotB
MRKRKLSSHENHERWLVSYADFVTLLFALFVVLFASTQTDKSRAKAVSEAVARALDSGSVPPKLAAILGGTLGQTGKGNAMMRGPGGQKIAKQETKPEAPPQLVDLAASMKILSSQLSKEIESQAVELRLEHRGLVIGLKQTAFFPSGGDTIEPSVYPTIGKVAAVLNSLPNALRLEGHTDSRPINTDRFKSNWELSAARSIAMLRLLSERFAVRRDRMAIIGYADTAAIDSNQTEEGRGRNRRVDIVILSDYGMRVEPDGYRPLSPSTKQRANKN